MGETDTSSLYGLIGSIVLALISGAVAVLVSKRGGKAGENAEQIERGVTSVEAWIRLVEQQNGVVAGMAEQIATLRKGQSENDGIIGKMQRDIEFMHNWKRAAIRYILELRNHSARHAPEETLPSPPEELLHDLRDEVI